MVQQAPITYDIAAIMGPILVILSLTEYLNFGIWKKVDASLVYLNGLFLFAFGIIVVRFHNIWTQSWAAMVTIVGWLTLILGTMRMLFPSAKQASDNKVTTGVLIAMQLTGLYLVYKAYLA